MHAGDDWELTTFSTALPDEFCVLVRVRARVLAVSSVSVTLMASRIL
jgi:hypothetical protein